jgi:hypothetical protein
MQNIKNKFNQNVSNLRNQMSSMNTSDKSMNQVVSSIVNKIKNMK